MARWIAQAGSGLSLTDVRRLSVELFASWPQDTPDEIWRGEVVDYDLPLSALNTIVDGSLRLVVDHTRPALPPGFTRANTVRGQVVQTLLAPGTRFVQVVAHLHGGDECVFYRALLGEVTQADPKHWTVQLIDPAQMGLPDFVAGNGPQGPSNYWFPFPNEMRVYGHYGVADDDFSPSMSRADWWRRAMEAFPEAAFGVGADLVFAAGLPSEFAGQLLTYTLDARARNLSSEGRGVRDYLSRVRRIIDNAVVTDIVRSDPIPAFLPPRTATVGGSYSTETRQVEGTLTASAAPSPDIKGQQTTNATATASLGDIPSHWRITGMSFIVTAHIRVLAGRVKVESQARAQTAGTISTGGGILIGGDTREMSVNGSVTYHLQPSAEALKGAGTVTLDMILQGLNAEAHAYIEMAVQSAGYAAEYDLMNGEYEPLPQGLNTPAISDDAWTFGLPGIWGGLRVDGLPGGGVRPATTRIKVSQRQGVYSEVYAGPLPSRAPVAQAGLWQKGNV